MRDEYQDYIDDVFLLADVQGQTVVEVGAGAGVDAIEFVRYGADVIAIEPTDNGVEKNREHADEAGVDIEVQQAEGEDIPLADDTADFVYSFGVLHHIPDLDPVMDEITGIIKPEGHFMCMINNEENSD